MRLFTMTEYAQNISRRGHSVPLYITATFFFFTLKLYSVCILGRQDEGTMKGYHQTFSFLFSSTNQKHEWG